MQITTHTAHHESHPHAPVTSATSASPDTTSDPMDPMAAIHLAGYITQTSQHVAKLHRSIASYRAKIARMTTDLADAEAQLVRLTADVARAEAEYRERTGTTYAGSLDETYVLGVMPVGELVTKHDIADRARSDGIGVHIVTLPERIKAVLLRLIAEGRVQVVRRPGRYVYYERLS